MVVLVGGHGTLGAGNIGHTFDVDATDEASLTKALAWGRRRIPAESMNPLQARPWGSALPRGTPDEVASTVRRYCEVLGSDGGCILGPAHFFQPDVPPENILAVHRD